jgi:uncharacterized MAPEG superfamily protein
MATWSSWTCMVIAQERTERSNRKGPPRRTPDGAVPAHRHILVRQAHLPYLEATPFFIALAIGIARLIERAFED